MFLSAKSFSLIFIFLIGYLIVICLGGVLVRYLRRILISSDRYNCELISSDNLICLVDKKYIKYTEENSVSSSKTYHIKSKFVRYSDRSVGKLHLKDYSVSSLFIRLSANDLFVVKEGRYKFIGIPFTYYSNSHVVDFDSNVVRAGFVRNLFVKYIPISITVFYVISIIFLLV